jgi:CheY-like chemotaxis protein
MNKRILVVEDQPDNRLIIRDMLARSPRQLLAKIRHYPAIVVSNCYGAWLDSPHTWKIGQRS